MSHRLNGLPRRALARPTDEGGGPPSRIERIGGCYLDLESGGRHMRLKSNLPILRRITLLSATSLTMAVAGVSQAQQAKQTEPLEEIVVTGTRASLRKALELKRDAAGVVDAIVAEDIGKFPDLNVSESLQRITGVTIERGLTGEGNQVSVRGLPPEYTRVTLNGMDAASGGTGREFDFNIFAAELFSSIRIDKTPSAELTEGGLAGTIDLRTPLPFDFAESKFLTSVGGQYAELGKDDATPRISGLFSWRNEDETFGVLASASYSESTIRNDTKQGFRYEKLSSNSGLDELVNARLAAGEPMPVVEVNGASISDPDELLQLAANTAFPVLPRVGVDILDRERLGLTGAVQFRPTPSIDLALSVLYAEFSDERERHTIDGAPGFSGTAAIPASLGVRSTAAIDYAVQGSFTGVSQRAESVDEFHDNDFLHLTLDGEYELADGLIATTELGYSNAKRTNLSRGYLFSHTGDFSYDLSNPEWPRFSETDFDYTDPSEYRLNQLRFNPSKVHDQARKGRADLEWSPTGGVLARLKGGLEYNVREKENDALNNITLNFSPTDTSTLPFSEVAIPLPVDNFAEGAPAGVVRDFLGVDPARGRSLLLPDSYYGMTSPNLVSSWIVEEKVWSGYVQSDWEFDVNSRPLRINLGVRVARTDQTSTGHQRVGNNFEPVSIDNVYTDTLPSLNIRWELADQWVLRLAANKAITRPTLSQLSAGTTVGSTNNLTASSGNPTLDPFRAKQFDVSLEWYFAPESLLSLTGFYKDMESFIVNSEEKRVIVGSNLINDAGENVSGREFTVRLPINGTGGELYGAELSYQQPFTFLPAPFDGLGMLANVTISRSKGKIVQGGQETEQALQGQSDLSYNVIGYYERGPFGLRAAYSFRGDYIDQFRSDIWPGGVPHTLYVDDRKQLDLSVRYQFNDTIQLYLDAINVTSTDYYSYDTVYAMSRDYFEQGRVYNFGVRATF